MLADLAPDLVVNTGDNLAHRDSVPVVARRARRAARRARRVRVRLQRLLQHRRCATRCATCCPTTAAQHPTPPAAVARPARRVRRRRLGRPDQRRAGLDGRRADDRVRRRRRPAPALRRPGRGRRPGRPGADLRLGVAHAPYLRVLDQFAADGYDAILAGHTHGGQVCLPGLRRADHQLRPRAGPRQGAAPAPGGLAARRPGLGLAARLGRPRHLAVRPGSGSPAGPRPPCSTLVARRAERPARSPAIRSGLDPLGYARRCLSPAFHAPGSAIGLWRSLVARLVRDEEAAGSNPVSPTL